MLKGVPNAFVPCSYRDAACLVVYSINSWTAATQGDVANPTDVGAAAGGVAPWVTALMAFARFATMLVNAWICWANSAVDGALLAMVGLGMHACLVLGRMVEKSLFSTCSLLEGFKFGD